ncbi:hypothetical protein GIB67_033126 [Kingdonia uniflora]|uniref:RRM domain-containing protein n=1 Tax=Kingdonia uniflora TaxID=39325 RepID=A0A7J7NBR2_9MAGN|nr:hypothetical protein GIB67_033126 [Kingdonia uniflora]
MTFASTFRRIFSGKSTTTASSLLQGSFASNPIRLNSTLATPTPTPTPKLFVSGLSRLTTNEKLKEAFSPFGQLLQANIVVDRASGRSKGFAFVRYATIEEAEKAREGMNAKFLDGWVIFVDPAKPREPRPPPPPPQQEPDSSEYGFRTNKTIGWCG